MVSRDRSAEDEGQCGAASAQRGGCSKAQRARSGMEHIQRQQAQSSRRRDKRRGKKGAGDVSAHKRVSAALLRRSRGGDLGAEAVGMQVAQAESSVPREGRERQTAGGQKSRMGRRRQGVRVQGAGQGREGEGERSTQ